MRLALSGVLSILIIVLLACLLNAYHSKRELGKNLTFLLAGMASPVIGNFIVIVSTQLTPALIGYYIYSLGFDAAIFALFRFTFAYCEMGRPKRSLLAFVYSLFAVDIILYILNPFLKLSFVIEELSVDGQPYFKIIPCAGHTYHKIICYGIFFIILIVYIIKSIRTSRVYADKYIVMEVSLLATGAVVTFYLFANLTLDMSAIGLGLYGVLAYYFSMHYRSTKLLDRMLAALASDTPDALFFFDKNGKCIWTNDPARALIGIAKDDYNDVKVNLRFLFGDIDFNNSGWCKKVTLGSGDEAQYTYIEMRSLYDDKGNSTASYLSVRDITEDQRELRREMYNSTHDSLTGLYTKEHLYQLIAKRLYNDKETDYMIGYMEISDIKIINDVFGRDFAEKTIIDAAEFIKSGVNRKSLYGRLSDDAFGILIDKEDFNSKPVADKIGNFTVKEDEFEHHVSIHYGVYDISKDEPIDVALFFDSARLATTNIKDSYQEHIVYYDDKLRNEIIHNQMISNQVRTAIETRQIRPYLQPIVNGRGLLVGAEALVRWIHPVDGFMSPGEFIPVFEKNGLIAEVDRYMWRCACEILSDWKKRSINAFISVNISPKDFYFMDVVAELMKLVKEFDIDPVKLRVEITETVMAADSINMFDIINNLKEHGFIVEMDDFGSGYSSLNLLKDMNIDLIKIDMQFLKDSERNMKVGLIIKNIINMAGDLEIDTLTEGVETAKQFENLFSMGCNLYQGYYFSKPVPLDEFEKQWFD